MWEKNEYMNFNRKQSKRETEEGGKGREEGKERKEGREKEGGEKGGKEGGNE